MKKLYLLIAFLCLCFFVEAGSVIEPMVKEQTFEVKMKDMGGDLVTVTLLAMPLPKNYVYQKAFMWGGDEFEPPRRIIRAIILARKGQNLYVPLSAYADLGDPTHVALDPHKHGFRLTITGGDAAGSYSAYLNFKKDEIASRKVVSGEFPDEVWEETNYSFNHLNN